MGTFVILCLQQHLYGKLIENAFYFVTMLAGPVMWKKNLVGERVETIALSKRGWNIVLGTVCLSMVAIWTILEQLDGSQVYLDGVTTVFAIAAQLLMIGRYQESWAFWFGVNVFCIAIWVQAGNWCMVAQYIFWTANCIYGMIMWNAKKK